MSKLLTVEKKFDGAIAEVILGKAPANIISAQLIGELMLLLAELEADHNCKMIVLAGEGDSFSYGASVEEHTKEQVGNMLPQFHLLIDKMLSSKIPILAKVKGNCLGGGFEVALACHFIFADRSATFSVPEIKLGVFPPPACALLNSKIADNIANEMIVTGTNQSAAELLHLGLLNGVADDSNSLDEMLKTFIEKRILKTSASSIRFATTAARMVVLKKYRANIKELENLYLKELMSTHDANEGIQSFIEKRRPVWTNH